MIFCKLIRSRRSKAEEYAGFLREQARAVNFVWNFCNELSVKHFERKREFMSAYDMQPYTKGPLNWACILKPYKRYRKNTALGANSSIDRLQKFTRFQDTV